MPEKGEQPASVGHLFYTLHWWAYSPNFTDAIVTIIQATAASFVKTAASVWRGGA